METGTKHGQLMGYLVMFRLGNCAMASMGALLAAIVCVGLGGIWDFVVQVALSMIIVLLFTAAGNSLNDYFDREVDKVAHPGRPIPSGVVPPEGAWSASIIMFSVALILSIFINMYSVLIVLSAVLVMVYYEKTLKAKGFTGNIAISWLTGALFLFGGVAVDRLELAWILAALAFLATLGREIVKDIQDMEGDRGSRSTLPMRIGVRDAGKIASVALVAAVALSPMPYLLDLLSLWYVPFVAVADAIFIYCALIHFRNPEKGQRVAKLAMLVALLAFLFGGVF
jgi:geranylgeranylglycerol-phosphate geranylgeranyltransferase